MYNEEEKTLTLKDLYDVFLTHRSIFAICTVVFLILSIVYFSFFTVPTYTSNSVIYVNCMSTMDLSAEEGISQYEIDSSRALSLTYMEILNGRTFLETISADIGYKYDWTALASMINVSQINETELLSISVTALTAEDAYLICKSVIDLAPEKMISVFKRGTIEVIDEVNMPTDASKTGVKKMVLIGVVLGILVATFITFLIEVFDTKVRSSEDLIKRYNINVVGEIFN